MSPGCAIVTGDSRGLGWDLANSEDEYLTGSENG
jgi:hypothetical protein